MRKIELQDRAWRPRHVSPPQRLFKHQIFLRDAILIKQLLHSNEPQQPSQMLLPPPFLHSTLNLVVLDDVLPSQLVEGVVVGPQEVR